jgi:hypothetical protein
MSLSIEERRCLGLDETCLAESPFGALQPKAAQALSYLQAAAREAGFDLQTASAFRSFERQRLIWNAKVEGRRPVLDDRDAVVDLSALEPEKQIERILRFSALPGASRHHWGTDVDVFDAAALPDGYRLGLTLAEVAPGGLFDAFHCWLDERIAAGESFGFYRPYDEDRGGVSPERWHLSYAPLAFDLESRISAQALKDAWREADRAQKAERAGSDRDSGGGETASGVALREVLEARLEPLLERFVLRVASPPRAALAYGP